MLTASTRKENASILGNIASNLRVHACECQVKLELYRTYSYLLLLSVVLWTSFRSIISREPLRVSTGVELINNRDCLGTQGKLGLLILSKEHR